VTVFLTGATGFVGMEVLLRLLEDPDTRVDALVRGRDQADADARLRATLDVVGIPAAQRPRVQAVLGELTEPGLGLPGRDADRLTSETTAVVHCAASVSWNLPLDEARGINLGGAQRVFEVAERMPRLERAVHVSTAYVAGRHEGRFSEGDLMLGQDFRNTYEQSKAESEAFVQGLAERLPITIVRPSIVVGESDSGWTPAFNVVYWPLRAFARGLLREVPALPQGRVDIVPIDYVADTIVHVLRTPAPETPRVVLATAGEEAATVEDLVALTCGLMDRERPVLVEVGSELGYGEEAELYASYFNMEVVFDDARSRALLEPAGIAPPPLEAYFARLLGYADRARWGKRPIGRAEARLGIDRAAA
jgi:thioester reductase-like protein